MIFRINVSRILDGLREKGGDIPKWSRVKRLETVESEGNVWGRPVGITVAKDGSLLFSEDGNKTIWRVSYVAAELR